MAGAPVNLPPARFVAQASALHRWAVHNSGTVANRQDWTAVKFNNGNDVWGAMNKLFGGSCTNHALATQGCVISSSAHDAFRTWDTRQ